MAVIVPRTKTRQGKYGLGSRLFGDTRLARHESLAFYAMIMPWIIGFIIFTLGPMILSFYMSFFDWPLREPPTYVGLQNYLRFPSDMVWVKALQVTATYTLGAVPLGLIFGFLLALLLNQKIPGMPFFRTVFYLPSLVPATANAILWLFVLNAQIGIINTALRSIGIQGPSWLGSSKWALPGLIIMSLWGVGGGMVIYLAGLQGIPEYLYEAAKIDGANQFQQFLNVTIPMMTPVIFFNLVMGIIGTFQVFNQAYIMTQGGPGRATYFYVYYLYRNSFDYYRMGYGSAMAWFLFALILVLTLLNFWLSNRWVFYESGEAS
jgi:multiple sugar transport system permease protein